MPTDRLVLVYFHFVPSDGTLHCWAPVFSLLAGTAALSCRPDPIVGGLTYVSLVPFFPKAQFVSKLRFEVGRPICETTTAFAKRNEVGFKFQKDAARQPAVRFLWTSTTPIASKNTILTKI